MAGIISHKPVSWQVASACTSRRGFPVSRWDLRNKRFRNRESPGVLPHFFVLTIPSGERYCLGSSHALRKQKYLIFTSFAGIDATTPFFITAITHFSPNIGHVPIGSGFSFFPLSPDHFAGRLEQSKLADIRTGALSGVVSSTSSAMLQSDRPVALSIIVSGLVFFARFSPPSRPRTLLKY